MVFLNVVTYASRADQENNEWRGRLKIITKTLESGIGQIGDQIANQNTEISNLSDKLDKQNSEMKSEIAGMTVKLDKMMTLLSKEN